MGFNSDQRGKPIARSLEALTGVDRLDATSLKNLDKIGVEVVKVFRRTRGFYVENAKDIDIPFDATWDELSSDGDLGLVIEEGAYFANRSGVDRIYRVEYSIIYPSLGSNTSTCEWRSWIEPYGDAGMRLGCSSVWKPSYNHPSAGDPKLTGSATFKVRNNTRFKVRTRHTAGSSASSGGKELGVELGGSNDGTNENYSCSICITRVK